MKTRLASFAGSTLCVALIICIGVLAWKFFTLTDPYVVKPLKSSPAPAGAMTGFSVANGSRTLSVFSTNDVVVVSDPGESSKYEVIWMVQQPRKAGTNTLMEFKCELPKAADVDQIKLLGSEIPPKVRKVAEGRFW